MKTNLALMPVSNQVFVTFGSLEKITLG